MDGLQTLQKLTDLKEVIDWTSCSQIMKTNEELVKMNESGAGSVTG